MAEVLLLLALVVLASVAVGLWQVLRVVGLSDKLMAAQLLGTGGIAVLLLLGAASGTAALVDVALVLGLLSAFATAAFIRGARMMEKE